MRIDGSISDLFFNTDFDNCRIMTEGKFVGRDDAKLREEAESFLGCVERLGIEAPTADELLVDFHARV